MKKYPLPRYTNKSNNDLAYSSNDSSKLKGESGDFYVYKPKWAQLCE